MIVIETVFNSLITTKTSFNKAYYVCNFWFNIYNKVKEMFEYIFFYNFFLVNTFTLNQNVFLSKSEYLRITACNIYYHKERK